MSALGIGPPAGREAVYGQKGETHLLFYQHPR